MKIQRKHIGTSNKLRVISTNGFHGAHQGFSVEPGETYTFEIDLHRPAGMNKEINVVIWKNTGPSGALSVHVLNVDGTNTFTYTATSSNIYIQIRQAGTYYLDNIRMYRTYEDTIFVSGYEVDRAYRYGFNGMEKDDEMKGNGNHYTTEWRQYDPRLGRFMSLDPAMRKYAGWSPYSFSFNNPIWWNDPNGDDPDGDPEKITTAASNAVATVKASDNGSTPAKCNIGVNCAFTEITGSNELSGKNANQMYDHMSGSTNFTPIDPSEAQSAANSGEVVIAAWKNPSGSSGHVALVVPGTAAQSGTWDGESASTIGGIPKVMDTGYGMRTESQSVNYSFGKSKQSDVVFFKYKPMISTTNSNDVSRASNDKIYGPIELAPVEVVSPRKAIRLEPKKITQIPTSIVEPTLIIR